MPRDFYPFVEGEGTPGQGENDAEATPGDACEVQNPARVAVYDDAAAAPRVVVIEPKDVRSYLEEITATVNRLSHEQGGTIPFMVIREIVENFIHAYFQAPTITILDGGDTIRFSDQGPGIREKSRALEYGTSSATEEMKRYIRGVGSGLPYVQQYMTDKGGSLDIEDNISGGTVVTISTRPREQAQETVGSSPEVDGAAALPGAAGIPMPAPQAWPAQPQWQPAQPAWPAYPAYGASAPSYGYGAPQPQQPAYAPQPAPSYGMPQAAPPAQGPYDAGAAASPYVMPQVALDERGRQALSFLAGNLTAGPTELVRAFGASSATWSRALNGLAAQGLVTKNGQKYQLTGVGRAVAESL